MPWDPVMPALGADDLEYMQKIDWLWGSLSPYQRSKVTYSIDNGTLRQENSTSCLIGQAVGLHGLDALPRENPILDVLSAIANALFYDGPSYHQLLGRKATQEERRVLDDIYYAKIGGWEHQYARANHLIRRYFARDMAVA